MTAYNLAIKATRVLVFTGGLIGLPGIIRFVLNHPALRTALGMSLLLLGSVAVLAAGAWMLRKLWILSGIVATVVLLPPDERSRRLHPDKNKIEVRA